MMIGGHVVNGIAIGNNKAAELPCLTEMILKQHLAGAGRHAVNGIVGTHDGCSMPLKD